MATSLSQLQRSTIRTDNTAPFLTTFEWEFEFTKVPDVINASMTNLNDLLMKRVTSVTVPQDPVNNPIAVNIRGHQFSQPGLTPNSGVFALTFQDFGDQAIQKVFSQLLYAMSDPLTRQMVGGNPNAFKFDCKIYRLDANMKRKKAWICKECLLGSCDTGEEMNSDKSPVGQGVISFVSDITTIEYFDENGEKSYYYGTKQLDGGGSSNQTSIGNSTGNTTT